MAFFVLTHGYNDTPLRAERRDDHVAYLKELENTGKLVVAGPFADRTAGIIVLRAEDEAAAQALVDGDPYTQLGVTKNRELREWIVAIGSVGG